MTLNRTIPALLGAVIAVTAAARDSSEGLPLPGAVSDPAASATAARTHVSIQGAMVSMALHVAAVASNAGLVIAGQTFGPVAADESYPARHFPELEVRIDGETVKPEDYSTAFHGTKNITLYVRTAAMDVWAITRSPPLTSAEGGNARSIKFLLDLGDVEKAGEGYLAHWSARRTLRIPLHPGVDQEVELRYAARPGFAPVTLDTLVSPARERDDCVSDKALRRLARGTPATAALTAYEYSIATGVDGVAPGEATFEFAPAEGDAAAQRDLLFLCGPHLQPIGAVGRLKRQPVAVDEHGILRVLRVSASPRTNP